MISICIPLYNYDVRELLQNLVSQLTENSVKWEILISDDASSQIHLTEQNLQCIQQMEKFPIHYFTQKKNLGNAANRNFLGSKAKFPWIIFLDADVLPVHSNFIEKYCQALTESKSSILTGNIEYKNSESHSLRQKYGRKKEVRTSLPEEISSVLEARGANFAIKTSVFLENNFPQLQEQYGFVDTMFFLQFPENALQPIQNPVYHLGIETNTLYVEKVHSSIRNALYIYINFPNVASQITLIQYFTKYKIVSGLMLLLYSVFGKLIKRNLESNHSSLFLLQLYKLLYFNYLYRNNTLQ